MWWCSFDNCNDCQGGIGGEMVRGAPNMFFVSASFNLEIILSRLFYCLEY